MERGVLIMKKTFKLKAIRRIAGLTIMLAAIAFSMAACSGDDLGPGGSGGGGGGSSGGKGITVIGIPSNTDLDLYVFKPSMTINYWTDVNRFSDAYLGEGQTDQRRGRNYTGVIKNWIGTEWKGSGNFTVAMTTWIIDGTGSSPGLYFAYIPSLSFSNGNATVNFSDFIEIPR
jgi:hypothetical protein